MKICALIHAPFEKLGAIETWIKNKGHILSETHVYKNEKLPLLDDFDFLIIMGGPQSTNETDLFPYLLDEIVFTRKCIAENKPVLGICLGAQIIAASLGAKTERSPNKEIGFFPITLTSEAEKDPVFKLFPTEFNVMHWHGEMPGNPENIIWLASSEGCSRQAFRYGDRVYGLQFHMETTAELAQGMIENCPEDLSPGNYIQDKSKLLSTDFSKMNKYLLSLLDYLSEKAS